MQIFKVTASKMCQDLIWDRKNLVFSFSKVIVEQEICWDFKGFKSDLLLT